MDRPNIVQEYLDNKKKIKELEKKCEDYKEELLSILSETGGWDDIYTETANYTKYNDELIFEWVKRNYSDAIVEKVKKETLDWDSFHSLVKLGEIDISNLPDECIYFSSITKVITGRKRKQDDSSVEGI